MARTPTLTLANSALPTRDQLTATGTVPADQQMSLTIQVAEPTTTTLPDPRTALQRAMKAQFNAALGQHVAGVPDHMDQVTAYLKEHGFTIERTRDGLGQLQVTAPASAVEAAFGVSLVQVDQDGQTKRSYEGAVHLPTDLDGMVQGVVGLDDLKLAPGLTEDQFQTTINPDPYTPQELAERYGFPTESDGSGRTIAVVLLDGGFYQSDMDSYFPSVGLTIPNITVIGENNPSDYETTATVVQAFSDGTLPPAGSLTDQVFWTIEATMDLQMAGSLANGAKLIAAFATDNSIDGATQILSSLLDLDPVPDVVSISWSFSEGSRSQSDLASLDRVLKALAAAGATVCACTGDYGSSGTSSNVSSGTLGVVYPASSHYALACGGTTLPRTDDAGETATERVWNTTEQPAESAAAAAIKMAGGGGFSAIYDQPTWQADAAETYDSTQRGLPDVSADADPNTGAHVLIAGTNYVSAGTSAATPTWAALAARLDAALDASLGLMAPHLYPLAGDPALDVISEGGNSLSQATDDWTARDGWSPASGLGSPNGQALLTALRAQLEATDGS